MTDMNLYAVVAITILGGTGLSLMFFGSLVTIASAFGQTRRFWGAATILFLPLSLVYCALYWSETHYQRKYLGFGLSLLVFALVCILFL